MERTRDQLVNQILHELRAVLLDPPKYQALAVEVREWPVHHHVVMRVKLGLGTNEELTIEWQRPLEVDHGTKP